MSDRVAKKRRHGQRFRARLRAVDLLFEAEARDIDPTVLVADRIELAGDQRNQVAPVNPYTAQVVNGVAVELDAIDDVIEEHLSEQWELDRIPAVDRAILRVAVWEILFNPEVPNKTAVVEAVEMAAHYGAPPASGYINGLLDEVVHKADEITQQLQAATKLEDEEPASGSVEEPEWEAPDTSEDS